MKPVRLEFAAFGSYPGEVDVDFTALAARGLFVVTGDTGTGKTTIFDAMSYALFGQMPLKEAGDIRSHHADPAQETYVRFTFTVDGETYVAERRPAQEVAKRRGSGTKAQSTVGSLSRLLPGDSTEPVASGVAAMSDECIRLIGLTADQLQRVMLLPQGDVTKFLLDKSDDREKLLRQLFGGAVYDRVVAELDQTSSQLQDEVGGADERLRHHVESARTALRNLLDRLGAEVPDDLATADRPRIEEHLVATTGERDAVRTAAETADRDAARLEADAALVNAEADRFDRVTALRAQAATTVHQLPDAERAEAAAMASRAARPVVEAADAAAVADREARLAATTLDERVAGIAEVARQAEVGVDTASPTSVVEAIAELRSSVQRDESLLDDRNLAGEAVAACTDERDRNDADQQAMATRRDQAGERLGGLAGALAAVEPQRADIAVIDAEHERLVAARSGLGERDALRARLASAEARHRAADDEHLDLMRRFVETEAPRLAARLVDGESCPVCGSPEHPAPAVGDGGEPVEYAQVLVATEARDAAGRSVQEVRDRLAEVTTSLAEWSDAEPADVVAAIVANRDRHGAAVAAEAEFVRLTAEQAAAVEEQRLASEHLARLEGMRSTIDTALAAAVERERIAVAAASAIDADRLRRRATAVDELGALAAGLEGVFTAVTTTGARAAAAADHLATVLAASSVDSVDAARAALLPPDVEERSIATAESLRSALTTTEALVAELERQGVPAARPDAASVDEQARTCRAAADELRGRLVAVDEFTVLAESELAEHDRQDAGSADLRRRAEVARRAHQVCRGNNAARLSLNRWVLGRELDRVTAAASVHLLRMTGSRYSIRRAFGTADRRRNGGLDLEVFDAHTGRHRSPRSLSGGEQFQTSLALALGLADVVSHGGSGSGRRMEALFIDEGFGSLDPRALDDAIETLHHLRETGRMVGAITHVEAMKERLHPGIVVTRLPDGKGSTLRVTP